ncbi:MAG TPA: phosphotransferase [Streptosporangiaceae bacterium]|nr:phosphotransferase [Streptosporangiaceae bacterium]
MTSSPATGAISGGADLTVEFLSRALASHLGGASVDEVDSERVGTGQVSDTYRLRMTYAGDGESLPATLIAKVPAADQTSRGAARAFRTYEIEASFYAQIAPGLPVALPECFYAAYDPEPDEYVVLLTDLAPAQPGDQLTGLSADQAAAAIGELAVLHAAGWDSSELAALPWLNRSSPEASALMTAVVTELFPGFRDRYAGRLEPGTLGLIEDFVPRADRYLADRNEPRTIVHGDFRADNLLFGGERPIVLDWQTASFGSATSDLSYFLGSSLPVPVRQEHEQALVRLYHSILASRGVPLTFADCWDGYRRNAFAGLVMDIIAAMVVQQTARGDDMFAAMASRHARHAIDLEALALVAD